MRSAGLWHGLDQPRWQNFSPVHHMRWERKPDLGFIKRNGDKRGLMECQELLSREAGEEVGIKGKLGSLRMAVLPWARIVADTGKRNFAQMWIFFAVFSFSVLLTWACSTWHKRGCRSSLLIRESGAPRSID